MGELQHSSVGQLFETKQLAAYQHTEKVSWLCSAPLRRKPVTGRKLVLIQRCQELLQAHKGPAGDFLQAEEQEAFGKALRIRCSEEEDADGAEEDDEGDMGKMDAFPNIFEGSLGTDIDTAELNAMFGLTPQLQSELAQQYAQEFKDSGLWSDAELREKSTQGAYRRALLQYAVRVCGGRWE